MSGPAGDRMGGTDPFEHDDAPYLLGSLDAADRRAFEAHLAVCAACTQRVASLGGVLGVLAAAGDEARAALTPASDWKQEPHPDRLAVLIQRVERRRRRTTWIAAGLGAVAAAAIVALTVTVAAQPSVPAAAARTMTAVGTAAIRATAVIDARSWGTEITIDCRYSSGIDGSSGASGAAGAGDTVSPGYGAAGGNRSAPYYPATPAAIYTLQVLDRAGTTHDIGSWTLTADTATRFTSGTALSPDDIRAVTVAAPDGTTVLRLTT